MLYRTRALPVGQRLPGGVGLGMYNFPCEYMYYAVAVLVDDWFDDFPLEVNRIGISSSGYAV